MELLSRALAVVGLLVVVVVAGVVGVCGGGLAGRHVVEKGADEAVVYASNGERHLLKPFASVETRRGLRGGRRSAWCNVRLIVEEVELQRD
ncbi:hypothetical protein VN97_g3685 [Penicillium thymicola]|uniref:Uncharacterized protein n=1 Tax=Penicillium thymicola TaxID=293382 RepID=A0AAI9TLN9_PENTH|nr:hypothetical protein VN97_g3685 [Penicillium thymicola]